jgi:hypothetical protein
MAEQGGNPPIQISKIKALASDGSNYTSWKDDIERAFKGAMRYNYRMIRFIDGNPYPNLGCYLGSD